MDSASVKGHPDGTGALRMGAFKPSAEAEENSISIFIWLPRVLSRSSASRWHPAGSTTRPPEERSSSARDSTLQVPWIMDRAYEVNQTRWLA